MELPRLKDMEVHFDGHCFGCGPLNPDGLQLKFEPGPDGSAAEYDVPKRFQSWAGMAHGGIVALMLDEAVGWAAWHAGHPGVTGRLQVSLRRPLKLGERIRIVGKVDHVRKPRHPIQSCRRHGHVDGSQNRSRREQPLVTIRFRTVGPSK